jgi:predicted NAD/FAD-binding protein
MRIAVIGAGIAGNVAAWHLHRAGHEVTVFEAGSHVGGHTHTHAVDGLAIDTGFIVYNERTYPNFSRLLEQLQVASQPSSMSFSVRNEASGLEWGGATLNTLFAQRRNLLRPRFHRMIADILRFNREAPRLLGEGGDATLGEYLARERYCQAFLDDYLVPMGAAIWSTHPSRMLGFPARFFVRFLHNHGMLSVNDRPQWRVVRGGSARYVERLTAPFRHRIRIEAATPTRRSRSSPTRRRSSARCWARSATRRTRRCCTPTPRSCRARGAPGPPGTTTCCASRGSASRSPTT